MNDKDEIPPEIALLLEKRETPDRRKAPPTTGAEGTPPDGSASPKDLVERRRGDRRKPPGA
jgi:hypothetical protein